jgi:hypothetical protein
MHIHFTVESLPDALYAQVLFASLLVEFEHFVLAMVMARIILQIYKQNNRLMYE